MVVRGRRIARWRGAWLACVLGCDVADSDGTRTIEIFSWWVARGEVEALEALLDVHARHHPDVEVINAAATNADRARMRLDQRFAQGDPPDTFQTNAGFDLTRWVTVDGGSAAQSKLEGLGWFFADEDLDLPGEVIDAVSFAGEPYAVPLNLHRNNSLFYNVAVLERHGLAVPTSFAELLAACGVLDAAGVRCFAAGGRDPWALGILLWANVMIASAGPEYHREFFAGVRDPNEAALERIVDDLFALWAYVGADAFDTPWTDAVMQVGDGDAAFTVMGDWAKGLLGTLGKVPGDEFGQVPFPGTQGTFVFTMDAFPLALGGRERDATIDLLRVIASPEGQLAFNVVKGSIPTRYDVPSDDLDVLGQRMNDDFHTAEFLIPAGLAPPEFALDPIVAEALARNDPEFLLNGIRDYYDVLRRRASLAPPRVRTHTSIRTDPHG